MIEMNKAKEKYNATEIPQELERVVKDAINKGTKKRPVKLYLMRLAPVTVCAAICVAIGINYLSDFGKNTPLETSAGDSSAAPVINEKALKMAVSESADSSDEGAFFAEENAQIEPGVPHDTSRKTAAFHNSFVMDKFDKSVSECVALETEENAYGEICEIYSDEEVVSYSVMTYPSNTINFYNITQHDGADISIEDILGDSEYNSLNCKFYIKEKNKLVIISDGEEIEVIIN